MMSSAKDSSVAPRLSDQHKDAVPQDACKAWPRSIPGADLDHLVVPHYAAFPAHTCLCALSENSKIDLCKDCLATWRTFPVLC